MSKLGKFKQTVDERKKYAIDYSEWLTGSELLVSVVVKVDPVTTPPLVIDELGVANADTGVVYFASGGVAGQTYVVAVEVTTSTGQVKEDKVYYVVTD